MRVDVVLWTGGTPKPSLPPGLRAAGLGWLAPLLRGDPPPRHRVLRAVDACVRRALGFRLRDGVWVVPEGAADVLRLCELLGTLALVHDGDAGAEVMRAASDEATRMAQEITDKASGARPRRGALLEMVEHLEAFVGAWGVEVRV